MEPKLKLQRGYLFIVITILIVVVGTISAMLVHMFSGNIKSAVNVNQSNAAFNVAQSALEIAKRDIGAKEISCNGYARTGNVLGGEYSITSFYREATSSLYSSISAADTIIPLLNAANFAATGGVIAVDNEMIRYTGISANNLTGVVRGLFGTTVASHNSGATVSQILCTLIATGCVPSISSPNGKRVLQESLNGRVLYGMGNGNAVVYSYGNTIINGNNIIVANRLATRSGSSPNYTYDGHTIISRGTVRLNGNNVATRINIPPYGLSNSSTTRNIQGDIIQNYMPGATKGEFFNIFFNTNSYPDYTSLVNAATTIQSSDVQITNGSPSSVSFSGGNLSINGNGTAGAPLTVTLGATGSSLLQKWNGNIIANGNNILVVLAGGNDPRCIVVTGSVTLNGNNVTMKIGSSSAPVALVTGGYYIENGNNIQTGLNGFIYARGNITFNGNNPTIGKYGIITSEGTITYNGNNITSDLNPSIVNSFGVFSTILNTYYTSFDVREIFQ